MPPEYVYPFVARAVISPLLSVREPSRVAPVPILAGGAKQERYSGTPGSKKPNHPAAANDCAVAGRVRAMAVMSF
jgi:hypothetical protein